MNLKEFSELAKEGYNRIPVVYETSTNLDSPLSTYLKLASNPYTYLLESAQGGEQWGRYSIIGLPCKTILKVYGQLVTVETNGNVVESVDTGDPLAFIEEFQSRFKVANNETLPRFIGGLVGYFSYDTVRFVENRLSRTSPPDQLETPDIFLMVSEDIVIFDNLKGSAQLISLADPKKNNSYEETNQSLIRRAEQLQQPIPQTDAKQKSQTITESDFVSSFGKEGFETSVEKIRDYIQSGDVMQVVLSQRMSTPFATRPINLYKALRDLNPSPYMYFMDLNEFQIVSSSPEILARVENGEVINRPLAGTRRRGYSEEEDNALEEELLADPKELAEHLMLIDLGRNDLGRVSKTGSVRVTEQFSIERYSHVMHISSNVTGQLREDKTPMDVLRATLPVGTLSGAPKIRAMEIIDELEPVKRGIYGGAVGYLSWNGNMDTAIAIRTAVIKNDTLYVQAGGGIVADSVPNLEWKESMNKARAIFRAAAAANQLEND